MNRVSVTAGALAALLVLTGLVIARRDRAPDDSTVLPVVTGLGGTAQDGLLHGRVTTENGDVYEGRLRFGRDEEALWGNTFNGYKHRNPWVDRVPRGQLSGERRAWEVFGLVLALERRSDFGRPFMARFGDITRIEARGRDLQVTLKSGSVVHLDRYAADDFADGVRVWDASRGIVDLREGQVRSIELLPGAGDRSEAPLQGTVHTREGDFAGLIQWEREAALGSDELRGRGPEGEVRLRFDAIRSISRRSDDLAAVTLLDGREIILSDIARYRSGQRGTYVDDPRYGRVLVPWEALERVDFGHSGAIPTYDDFPAGRPLTGEVLTRSGSRLSGRLVYDLDESETTETLDAPARGIDYMIPFARIASIEPLGSAGTGGARITLHGGEVLELEPAGDLSVSNGGMLIFADGDPDYVPWAEVERVRLLPASAPTEAAIGAQEG